MSAIETDPGWYERMAQRAAGRRLAHEAEEYANNPPRPAKPIHLHGTMTACDCGAEKGVVCVAFPEDYVTPDVCETCGKPFDLWCDTMPFRSDVVEHDRGCRAHPDVGRCTFCGEPMIGSVVYTAGRQFHFGCTPGALTWDPELEKWRDRDGNLTDDSPW